MQLSDIFSPEAPVGKKARNTFWTTTPELHGFPQLPPDTEALIIVTVEKVSDGFTLSMDLTEIRSTAIN